MPFTPTAPHSELPPLPQVTSLLTADVFRAHARATRALAELNGVYLHSADPATRDALAAIRVLIPLMESQASNEIENVVTTNDELFRAAHNALPTITPQVKEALRYRETLEAGCHHKEISLNALSAWERFLNLEDSIEPLLGMILGHYQFEAIHPFSDGHGHTGRILNLLYLVDQKLLSLPILYLSGYINGTKAEYYTRLRRVTENPGSTEWEAWILYMLQAVEVTARWTLGLIDATTQHRARVEEQIRQLNSRIPAGDLGTLLFSKPYLRIRDVVDSGLAQRQTAAKWLQALNAADIVQEETHGKEKIFVHTSLLDIFIRSSLF